MPEIVLKLTRKISGSNNPINIFTKLILELAVLSVVIGLGWLLIGYYTNYAFLATGYQDWMYHAFKVKSLQANGISSWDHIWANGINHWRAYQYIPHLITNWISHSFKLDIPQAMIWTTVFVFIYLRVATYAILRSLQMSRLVALSAVVISYAFAQQWQAIRDFSIYIALVYLPIYLFVWIQTFNKAKLIFLSVALAGFAWTLHPVMGFSLTLLEIWTTITRWSRLNKKVKLGLIGIFLTTSASFTIPVLTVSYKYTNPYLSSSAFLKSTLPFDYLGLSLVYVIALAATGTALIFRTTRLTLWAKLAYVYSLGLLGLVWLGKNGYTGPLVNQFQFSRTVSVVATILPLVFASAIQALLSVKPTMLQKTIMIVLVTITALSAIETASNHSAEPLRHLENPVAKYLTHTPSGSVYYHNDAEASFFSDNIRMVGSYNDHLLPSPLSLRFKNLMKANLTFAGVAPRQVLLIESYSKVLGVEYIFLPKHSPLIPALTQKGEEAVFALEATDVYGNREVYSVLRSIQPVSTAYVMDQSIAQEVVSFQQLPKPTLNVSSFEQWDDQIVTLAKALGRSDVYAVNTVFNREDALTLDLNQVLNLEKPTILLMENFDDNWQVDPSTVSVLKPTSLRFMYLELTAIHPNVVLTNTWPVWHWPVQLLGVFTLLTTVYSYLTYYVIEKLQLVASSKKKWMPTWRNISQPELISNN